MRTVLVILRQAILEVCRLVLMVSLHNDVSLLSQEVRVIDLDRPV